MTGIRTFSRTSNQGLKSGSLMLQGGVALDSTLRPVVDKAGTTSPLQLSTSQVAIGAIGVSPYLGFISSLTGSVISAITQEPSGSGLAWEGNNFNFRSNAVGFFVGGGSSFITPTARLHVRGDGTNPIAIFENSTTLFCTTINYSASTGNSLTSTGAVLSLIAPSSNGYGNFNFSSSNNYTTSSSNQSLIKTSATFQSGATATAGQRNLLELLYTINNTGAITGGSAVNGIFLNATETNLNGQVHNLMNLAVGGLSKFRVTNNASNVASVRISSDSSGRRLAEFDGTSGRWLGDGASYITPYDYSTGFATIASSSSFGINFAPQGSVSHSINKDGTRLNFGTAGAGIWTLTSAGSESISGGSLYFRTTMSPSAGNGFTFGSGGNFTWTTGVGNHVYLDSTFAAAAGSGSFRPLSINYTINNSGAQTGTATGIFLNATETNLNGMAHNLMDLQVGENSRFLVKRNGDTLVGNDFFTLNGRYYIVGSNSTGTQGVAIGSPSHGVVTFNDASLGGSVRLNFGGATNLFPALKRNGTTLEVKLADDVSGYTGVVVGGVNTSVEAFSIKIGAAYSSLWGAGGNLTSKGSGKFGDTNGYDFASASAILQADSTTRGFLPPRMTTTQKNLISTPATGLVVFDTDLGKLCVFSTTWQTVTSV